ncbi:MAG: isoprenylcysteine carboxylmethyltransferase family protein [Caldilineaceae bacterium]|nr:isoprenylcysteine carboxylmethyltransferase family protein [Caldilineaceae bacterium]
MKPKVPPLLLVVLISIAMYLLAPHLPAINIGQKFSLLLSAVVFTVGACVAILAIFDFRRAHTTVDPLNIENVSTLVTSGVFGMSRNPMYLGFALFLLAFVIYLNSPVLLVGVAGFILYITMFQIVPEEQAMLEKFGDEYRGYMLKVRRWV